MTTKILALTDALGNLVRFVLLPGLAHVPTVEAPSRVAEPLVAFMVEHGFA